ncbi:MAG: WecB/TagA/CpsF family glycosyltransferase [Anaerolineae bacterium]|nr:WecB/TagA/CpsF family glycosyltransferase [Anaerolineae bacterium]
MNLINILGVGISPIDIPVAIQTIDGWIQDRQPHYVCVIPVHSIMLAFDNPELRTIINASGMVTPDGVPVVWVSRLFGFKQTRRVYGPDLMLALCEHSTQNGYAHYFYGGAEGVPEKLVQNLQQRCPGVKIAGTFSPPFRTLSEEEDQRIIDTINGSGADIVWVGLGSPKQEYWMASHRDRLTAPVLIGVGAAFDFHAGVKKQAPLWMQRSGLEWLFRLLSEPSRLWKRYLVNNPRFVWHVILQACGLRKYPLDQT